MSDYTGIDLPDEHAARGEVPSSGAHQCRTCGGIAFNPVCPYCSDDDNAEDEGE